MAQSLYASHSTTAGNYPVYAQYRGTGIMCFGTAGGTLLEDFETQTNYTENSLTRADDTNYHKQGTKSMALTAFNAASDYAQRDVSTADWSSFTGFKFWLRSNIRKSNKTKTGRVTIHMIDSGARDAWFEASIGDAGEWHLVKFSKSAMTIDSGFLWNNVWYLRFYTSEPGGGISQYNLDALYGTGSGMLKFWHDGTDIQCDEASIGFPNVKLALTQVADSAGVGAIAAGTRYYRFAWVNDETDPVQEGALSAAVTWTNGDARDGEITLMPDPNDTNNIQRLRIYRTLSTGTELNGPYYFLVELVEGTASYTDVTTDATLGGQRRLPDDKVRYSTEVPDCGAVTICADRAFYYLDPDYPKRVYFSPLAKPLEMNTLNYNDLAIQGNDHITGGFQIDNVMYLTTNRSVWRISNLYQDPGAWRYDDLETGVGCVGHRTIQKIGIGADNMPVACWLSDYPLNVYLFVGGKCIPIGDRIMPKLEATPDHMRKYCPSAIDGERQWYVLGLASSTATDDWDLPYAYDFKSSRKAGKPVWKPLYWNTFTALGSSASGGHGYLYDGDEAGYVWIHENTTTTSDVDFATAAVTITQVSGDWYRINGDFTHQDAEGAIAVVASGTGADSRGKILYQYVNAPSYTWFYIPTWTSTAPDTTSSIDFGMQDFYYYTKEFDLQYASQFAYLHLYFIPTAYAVWTIEWYLDRSTTAEGSATVTITDDSYYRIGIPCQGRQIQFKMSCYQDPSAHDMIPGLIGYKITHIPRSEVG